MRNLTERTNRRNSLTDFLSLTLLLDHLEPYKSAAIGSEWLLHLLQGFNQLLLHLQFKPHLHVLPSLVMVRYMLSSIGCSLRVS